MKLLGIDYGLKKVGLAIGDADSATAVPWGLIPGGEDLVLRLCSLIKEERIDQLVVGLPIPTDSQQGVSQLDKTVLFARALEAQSALPVIFINEQFSSAEAKRIQSELGSKVSEDALAAMIILQAFLDGERAADPDQHHDSAIDQHHDGAIGQHHDNK